MTAYNGTAGDDTLSGRIGGGDHLQGLAGNDILIGRPNDVLDGGLGIDTVSYALAGGPVQVFLSGGGAPGGDAFGSVYISIENAIGSPYGDYISGNGQNNTIHGGDGADTLYGFALAGSITHLFGDNGDDTLVGGPGIDILDGGAGENTVSYFLSLGGVTVSLANQLLNTGDAAGDIYANIHDVIGTEYADTIYGSAAGALNQLQGQGGDDMIYGGGAAYTVLIGGSGADVLHPGAGGNEIDYETATSGVTANLLDPKQNTGDARGDSYIGFINPDLAGSPYDDILYGDNGNNVILGDPDVSVYGRYGNDQLYGGGGNDVLQGDQGADRLDGGDGIDAASYANMTTGVVANMSDPSKNTGDAAGDTYVSIETLIGTAFNDTLVAAVTDTALIGGLGDDILIGKAGNDTLAGGAGADAMDGGGGYNTAVYNDSPVGLTASLADQAQNTGYAAGDRYTNVQALLGTSFNDVLVGDDNENGLTGGSGDDWLIGGGGSDYILGGDGNDAIVGGAGNDLLVGGLGADTFVYRSVTESQSTPKIAPDIISDFQTGLDKIDVSALTPTSVAFGVEPGFYDVIVTTASGLLTIRSVNAVAAGDVTVSLPGATLAGTAGPDVLTGGAGNDTLIGGGGSDTLTGGAGLDTFLYQTASDSSPNSYDVIADFQTGSDVINLAGVSPSQVSVVRQGGNSSFIFVTTPSGPMIIAVNGAVNGTDIVGAGTLPIYVIGDHYGDTLIGSANPDPIQGGNGGDVLVGGGGADAVFGGTGANVFKYLAVADSNGAAGYDNIFNFKTGIDTVDFTAVVPSQVSLVNANGSTLVFATTPGGLLQLASVSHYVNGSDIAGLGGRGVYASGDDNGDLMTGSVYGDVIAGGAGNDTIIGGGGADLLTGGAGADIFRYAASADSVPGAADTITDFTHGIDKLDLTAVSPSAVAVIQSNGISTVFVTSPGGVMQIAATGSLDGSDIVAGPIGVTVQGGAASSVILGSAFNDTLFGEGGNDVLAGGAGADVLFGGAGADLFVFQFAPDSTPGAADLIADFQSGQDRIDLSGVHATALSILQDGGNSLIFANTPGGAMMIGVLGTVQGSDIAAGGIGVVIQGDAASTVVMGSANNDTLFGEAGNDMLVGGGGGDLLFGGAGFDTFRYFAAGDSTSAAPDLIADFQTGIDKIDLTGTGVTAIGIAGNVLFGSGPGGIAMQIGSLNPIAVSDVILSGPAPAPLLADSIQPTHGMDGTMF